MNFFEHQDEARKSTRRLVVLFSLAVISILVITNFVLIIALSFIDSSVLQHQLQDAHARQYLQSYDFDYFANYFNVQFIAWVSLVVLGVIGFVILFKRSELSGGGKVIAQRLGGKKITQDTEDFHERVILNVVEEMAIASGIAVPPVYLLPENSINAFAAGFEPGDAVIGISKGAIENLDRDQLQGVVAHEFSHIFNGDMRLNINLIAVLAGILFIGHAGWFFVRAFGGGRRYRSNRDSGSSLALLGLALVILGALGTFFGNLIKAAVSRQREFLADASAVQFTRNPSGIAGALKKIGGSIYGSRLMAPHASEMSHLFFGNALGNFSMGFSSWMATHPPLEERIRRIEPRWDGKFLAVKSLSETEQEKPVSTTKEAEKLAQLSGLATVVSQAPIGQLSNTLERVGSPDQNSYQQARENLKALDDRLVKGSRKPDSAKTLIYLLLVDGSEDVRKKQFIHLKENESSEVNEYLRELEPAMKTLPRRERLGLVEMTIPALKEMTEDEYEVFINNVIFLVKADNQIALFEWLLHSLLIHFLKSHFSQVKPIKAKYRDLSRLRNECKFLLSYITYEGIENNKGNYQEIFAKGFDALDLGDTAIAPREQLQLSDLNNAMFHFKHLFPLVKPKLLKACAQCIQADGHVSIEQYEMLRVIAALLDCPMPLMQLELENEKH